MNAKRIAGTTLLTLGVALLVIGIDVSHPPSEQWNSIPAFHFTGDIALYIVAGIALSFIGLTLEILSLQDKRATEPA